MAFVSDSFTGTNGTALSAHSPESGGPWTLVVAVGTELVLQSGRARGQTNSRRTYAAGAAPATPEYDVSLDLYAANISNATGGCGPAGRMSTGADTGYSGTYQTTPSAQYSLQRFVAGSLTVLGTALAPSAWVSGQTRTLRLSIRNATKKLFENDVELISSTDNVITAAGKAGIDHQGFSNSATNGWHIDNFLAEDVGGTEEPPPDPQFLDAFFEEDESAEAHALLKHFISIAFGEDEGLRVTLQGSVAPTGGFNVGLMRRSRRRGL